MPDVVSATLLAEQRVEDVRLIREQHPTKIPVGFPVPVGLCGRHLLSVRRVPVVPDGRVLSIVPRVLQLKSDFATLSFIHLTQI